MNSDVTKRTLSAGLGVGALALLARRASADTPFSSFAFPATGAPTARTLPDRLAEIKNVKDFGAKGNGTTDDAPAINAMLQKPPENQGNSVWHVGTIYFPPGNYRLASPINLGGTYGEINFHFLGSGMGSRLIGDMGAQFIFNRPVNFIANGQCSFEKLVLDGFGGIQMGGLQGFAVRDCTFYCTKGLFSIEECWVYAENCAFNGNMNDPNSIAAVIQSGGMMLCRIQGCYHGIRGGGVSLIGVEIEQCRIAILMGIDQNGNEIAAGGVIFGGGFEGNGIGIAGGMNNMLISSCSFQGHNWSPGPALGVTGNESAIKLSGGMRTSIIQNCVGNGWYSGYAIDMRNAVGASDHNIIQTCELFRDPEEVPLPNQLPAWSVIPGGFTVIACNNPR